MKTVELFLFGIASVVDLALLLALWERVNRGRVAVWLTSLVAGATLVHAAIFLRLLIGDAAIVSIGIIDRTLVSGICFGLLILPSAMLHAAIRINHTGIDPYPAKDNRYGWLYLPAFIWPVVASTVWQSSANNFIDQVETWRIVYLIWLVLANTCSIALLLRSRGKHLSDRSDSFALHLSILIAVITILSMVYGLLSLDTTYESPLRILATISPLIAVFLFIWHSMYGRLLPLVLERTFVYAAILATLILTHRLFVAPLAGFLRERTGVDFFFVELILIAGLMLLVPSLRVRASGSLRQMFSFNFTQVRRAIREVSLQLSQNATRDASELVHWFAVEVRQSLELDYVTVVLGIESLNAVPMVAKAEAAGCRQITGALSSNVSLIHQALSDSFRIIEVGSIDDETLGRVFVKENALLAYRISYRSVTGMVLLGNRIRNDRIAREHVEVLGLVVDQFAATLHNRREETLRQLAERKILQQEKLSALGLLSGSLAHELRNPLSSIRTIATLVSEELGKGHACERDLQMVVSEIDRLAATANRLLAFSKPESSYQKQVQPDHVIKRVAFILDYLAIQHQVKLSLRLACEGKSVFSDEASLSEIVFNLVKNAIEAAREVSDGKVEVVTKCHDCGFHLCIVDNGAGVPKNKVETLFLPFATHKQDGTGLGLYAVSERVRELGGSIEFKSNIPSGTVFEVILPMVEHDGHLGC